MKKILILPAFIVALAFNALADDGEMGAGSRTDPPPPNNPPPAGRMANNNNNENTDNKESDSFLTFVVDYLAKLLSQKQ